MLRLPKGVLLDALSERENLTALQRDKLKKALGYYTPYNKQNYAHAREGI